MNKKNNDVNVVWNSAKNERLVEGKPLVFHCHHYNCFLQRTMEDIKLIDGKGIQVEAAREVSYEHFRKIFSSHQELKTPKQRFAFASKLFRVQGYGLIDFGKANRDGGKVFCPVSHYAKGWVSKWGKRKSPMCYFNAGWIAGVFAAVFAEDVYSYDVRELKCEAVKGRGCLFEVELR